MVDPYTRAQVYLGYSHNRIHEGSAFYAQHIDSSMADTDTIKLLLVTPDTTTWIHLIWGMDTTGNCTVEFYEACTTSNDGTALSIYNRQRNSALTPSLVVKHTPTVTNNGTLLQSFYSGSSGRFVTEAVESRNENEWILKQNTKYLIQLTAHASIKGRLFCNWSEQSYRGLEGWQ